MKADEIFTENPLRQVPPVELRRVAFLDMTRRVVNHKLSCGEERFRFGEVPDRMLLADPMHYELRETGTCFKDQSHSSPLCVHVPGWEQQLLVGFEIVIATVEITLVLFVPFGEVSRQYTLIGIEHVTQTGKALRLR